MYYWKRKRKRMYVVVDKYDWLAGCWITPVKYPTINGESIHRMYAPGVGSVVRHLCCNKKCINPLHMIRGTQQENVDDERIKWLVCVENRSELNSYWYYRILFKKRVID